MPVSVRKITFPGSQGSELAARLDLPAGAPRAYALFAHCFTCGKDLAAATRITVGLRAAGFAVLRFDFTGLGSSEGEFANTNFSSNVDDLVAAADMLRERHRAPTLLVGHSLGGAAVLAAAARIPEARAVATIAAPADPAHVTGLFSDATVERIARDGEAPVMLAGREFTVREQFLADASGQRLEEAIAGLRRALLVLHSPVDNVVSVEHARRIFEAARHPKSYVSLDDADHLLSDRADAAYAAEVLAAWAGRYVEAPPEVEEEPPEGQVVVEESGVGAYAQTIRAGHHTLSADEPAGTGDDTGPTPYDLLLAGLGACTSMTLRMYAARKQLPLEGVRVTLNHERVHAEDSGAESGRRVERIERVIDLAGDLSDETRARLVEIAERCPVHRTLESDLRIVTSEATSARRP